jgi:glutaminase
MIARGPVGEYLRVLHADVAARTDGAVADYVPELARADPDPFGIALSTLDGTVYAVGDADRPFTIQSVSKPFAMALALQDRGVDGLLAAVGVEPTGDPFNAVTLEERTGRPLNPMVNAGAIVTSSLVAGDGPEARSERIRAGLSAFAGRPLEVDDRVLRSELATADRNRALAYLMRSMGALDGDVAEALAVYCGQCATLVTARDLAVMAATLADGGRNPVTGEQVVRPDVVTYVLSVMLTCGLYDFSGEWMFRTGMPAKSGVAGGIAAVLPGELGLGTFSPRLDRQGNSVRGVAACEAVSGRFGLHVMRPRDPSAPALHRRRHGRQVRSRRGRPARERAVLEAAPAVVVYELQGALAFREAELVARRAAAETSRWLVLDAARVHRVDPVAERLLAAAVHGLADRGVTVLRSGPWPPGATSEGNTFAGAADAVEHCEDVVLAEAGLPGPATEVPLAANDLCRGMSAADVEALRGHGAALTFRAGDDLPGGDALLLVTRGVVDLAPAPGAGPDDTPEEAPADKPDDAPDRLTSRAAGTAVGSAASGLAPTAVHLVARTDGSGVGFTPAALAALERDHPRAAAILYRNATADLAAEYRWSAAEHVALAR